MHWRRGHWVRNRSPKGGGGAGMLALLVLGGFITCINKVQDAAGCGTASKEAASSTSRGRSATPAASLTAIASAGPSDKWAELSGLFRGQDTDWLIARADLAMKTKPLTTDALREAYLALGSIATADRKRQEVRRLERLADSKSRTLKRASP